MLQFAFGHESIPRYSENSRLIPGHYAARQRGFNMLKATVKKTISEDYWLFLSWYRDRFGILPAVLSYIDLLRSKGIGVAPNPLTSGSVLLRPGTADQSVYDEIFLSKEYDINLGNPLFIVDAGAHIGLSSVFFASKYPKATVIAIEPEPSNFDILLRNAKHHTNIKPIQAGLWSRKAHLRIQDNKVATWSFRVSEDSSGNGIPAIGIRDVMSDFNMEEIDLLKIDIEGSELEVLNHSQPWIHAVKTLIIELHERYKPGCTEALAKALSGYAYDKSRSGDSVIITNLRKITT
jgi:FkbM family methyltransferase